MTDDRARRIAQFTDQAAKLRETINPITVAILDGQIAASDPTLLLREARILVTGCEEILEELRACVDLGEFDTLEKLLHLARGRLAEIKRALAPLLSEPS
jgi:hypothetical protein